MRCGSVALLGPPNAGKSTLLNALVGERVAATGPRPQTTRLLQKGVVNAPGGQLVLVDAPGLLKGANALEWGMREAVLRAAKQADAVMALASADTLAAWKAEAGGMALDPRRTLLAVTKSDKGLAAAKACGEELAALLGLKAWLTLSAERKKGLGELVQALLALLPEGEPEFAEDELTDLSLRQEAAEIVREQALLALREELPHSLAVGVEDYKEREDGLHEVHATLYVERESQKGMVIGKGGSMLKTIGTRARQRLERLAGAKVHLKLWVKVAKDWKKDPRFLKALGYPSAKEPR